MNVIVSNKYQTLLANLNVDVIKNINGVFSVDDLAVQFKNFYFNKMILDITALEDYEDINTIQKLSVALDMNKVILLLDDSPKVNSSVFLSQLVSIGIYNFTKNIDQIEFLMDNPNTYKDVASFHQLNISEKDMIINDRKIKSEDNFIGQRIIGIKNLTDHAGSTTLTYLLKHHIEKLYKVKAVETDKKDFEYFNDEDLDSITSFQIQNYLTQNSNMQIILIDINSDECESYCTDVIYLIEPGLIPLNKLVQKDGQIFNKLKGKKIVLNRSFLSNNDVTDFERESGSKVFFNIPSLDDKLDDHKVLKDFLRALGFTRFSDDESKGGFNLFK